MRTISQAASLNSSPSNGRRRVGKTFLVKELFEGQFTFRITGKDNVSTKEQLINFNFALNDQLSVDTHAQNWTEAFHIFQKALEERTESTKIIFFDELPWFDTHSSKFISALEHFWNDWASYRNDIKLITCGSATTWMLDQVINSRGGELTEEFERLFKSLFKIDGSINTPCSWSYRPSAKIIEDEYADEDLKHGTQIDLLIDRSDKSISICEMKYSSGEYEIDKAYDNHLAHRLKVFKKVTKTNKTLIPTFITPHGLYNKWII